MKIAVCPGSFDPITKGHLDIISRASILFDQVIVLVTVNPDKSPFLSLSTRLDLIQRCIQKHQNVTVDSYQGLLADYVKEKQAAAIVKGLRAVSDFEYEFQMALANQKLYPQAQTVFLTAQTQNMYLSSSLVRQIAAFDGDISEFVPFEIKKPIEEIFRRKQK